MLKKMPSLTMLLVGAILIGLIAHGFELFMPIEGNNPFGWIKALGFPLALECGNAIGLFVAFSHQTKGGWTRFVAIIIGLLCLASSVIIQFHFYKGRIDYDGFYSVVLPMLVALLSALAGLLDRDHAATIEPADLDALVHQSHVGLERSLAQALAELPELVRKEVKSALSSPMADGGESQHTEKTAILDKAQSLLLVGSELPTVSATKTIRNKTETSVTRETESETPKSETEAFRNKTETTETVVVTETPKSETVKGCELAGCTNPARGRSAYCSDSHRALASRNKLKQPKP